MQSIPKLIVSLLVVGFILASRLSRVWDGGALSPVQNSPEFNLMRQAYEAPNAAERQRLLTELDKLPVQAYPFYLRWLMVNEVDPRACWTDAGYDATRCDFIPEVQWLEVTNRGVSDIDNGGLLQFFGNDNGTFAPEMVQWFDQAGLPEAAGALRKGMALFGNDYPRSWEKRAAWLEGKSEDMFAELDDSFLAAIDSKYDAAADRWLREKCGVKALSDAPPKAAGK